MLQRYFDDLTKDLENESRQIRQFFATHRPSGGTNREHLIANLLSKHIIPCAGVETGLILSKDGEFSNQSDIILIDRNSNTSLHGHRPIPLWLMESVYGVIEVKTKLTPKEISDSITKCEKFKKLDTNFEIGTGQTKIHDSLFCIWAFEASKPKIAKKAIEEALKGLPRSLHPDFVVVPGSFLVIGGKYYELSKLGQPGSHFYKAKLAAAGNDPSKLLIDDFEMLHLENNTLFTFIYWINSWISQAGPRRPNILSYYPVDEWGIKV